MTYYAFISFFLGSEETKDIAAILGLAHLFPSVPFVPSLLLSETGEKSLPWRPTRAEVTDGIVTLVPNSATVPDCIKTRVDKVGSKKLSVQPFLIAIGDSWSKVTHYHLHVTNGVSYVFTFEETHFRDVLEILYKTIWALGVRYPYESKANYNVIEKVLFLNDSSDISTPAHTVINEILRVFTAPIFDTKILTQSQTQSQTQSHTDDSELPDTEPALEDGEYLVEFEEDNDFAKISKILSA